MDDQAGSSSSTGFSAQPEFQVPLFTAGSLEPKKQHTVFLSDASTDSNKSWSDIDFARITLGDGVNSTVSTDITLDDGASNTTHLDGWNSGSNSTLANQYYQSTSHLTQRMGAAANMSFWGNAIQIFGAVSNNHGPFTVSLDGGPTAELTGAAWQFYPQTLLYSYSGLSGGPHNLVITYTSQNSSEWLDLDNVIVSRWEEPRSFSGDSSKKPKSISPGIIAGIVVAAVAFLVLLGFLFFFLHRRRRGWASGGSRRRKSTRGPRPMDLLAEPNDAVAVTRPVPRYRTSLVAPSHPATRERETILLTPHGYSVLSSVLDLSATVPTDRDSVLPQYDEVDQQSQENAEQRHLPASTAKGATQIAASKTLATSTIQAL